MTATAAAAPAAEASKVTSLAEARQGPSAVADVKIDMFSLKGFELACRIAKAFATSDAVPVQFRSTITKKDRGGGLTFIDNPAAIGNCIVAIEVAQAVGMSITAVMQNADVIEGKLRWSGKFVIAAINASGRFTPLNFKLKNLGKIKATYKETYWENREKRTKTHEIELENWECVAWAHVRENGRKTDQVIESVPVSFKLAVEEGWYGKSGSKWQTELKWLMLQYRAGTYFGNIHAPDIVMGMGRTAEEERDVIEVVRGEDGVYAASVDQLRQGDRPSSAGSGDVKAPDLQNGEDPQDEEPAAEQPQGGGAPAATEAGTTNAPPAEGAGAAAAAEVPKDEKPKLTYAQIETQIHAAKTRAEVDAAKALIAQLDDDGQKADLHAEVTKQIKAITPKKPPIAAE